MSFQTTSHFSLTNNSSQGSQEAPIHLTDSGDDESKKSSVPTHSSSNISSQTIIGELIDLVPDDDVAESSNTPRRRSAKRKATRQPEPTTKDYTPSKHHKRSKRQYLDSTEDDDTSPGPAENDVGTSTPVSEATTPVNRLRRLIHHVIIDDEIPAEDTVHVDMTADPDGSENAMEVYDILSDLDDILTDDDEPQYLCTRRLSNDDEIQYLRTRRRLKEKKRRKVRQVLDPSRQVIDRVNVNGINIENGCCVEFQDGTFMKVCTICPEQNHTSTLVGKVFTRITETETLMPNQRDSQNDWKFTMAEICKLPLYVKKFRLINEVCQRTKIAAGEAEHDKGLWRRPAHQVKRLRTLIMTNQTYEDNCILDQHVLEYGLDEQIIEAEGELRCRWKEVIMNDEYGKVKEHRLERPTSEEVSRELFAEDEYLRRAWRGTSLNLAASKTEPTMAEACCGAGGMTLGAQMAGLDVQLAFDYDEDKIATHELNFPTCESMHMAISDWIQWAEDRDLKFDVLHLSPPCQPFSPACTTPNPTISEPNEAVLLACGPVIERVRPRVVTIEESDGLLNRHSKWFGALISQFTELGFSIRWACLNCNDFGVPQLRKRFFLIASAPGEDLPTFPEPTHEPGTVSIQKTLDELEALHRATPLKYHNPKLLPPPSRKPPYDADSLAKTITCKGGDNYHPSGLRNFTIQEFLALQTFPYRFRFPEMRRGKVFPPTEMKAQIGNAVPPLVGKAILSSVKDSLIASDQRRLEEFGGANENDAIRL